MQKSRSQLSEQGYMASRGIQQGAQSRGLGSSGLKDLGLIQSQMAQGKATSQLESQNTAVQRAAMDARIGMGENLRGALSEANVQRSRDLLDADKYAQHRKDTEDQKLLQLIELAATDMPPEQLALLASSMGIKITGIGLDENMGDYDVGNATDGIDLSAMRPGVYDDSTIDAFRNQSYLKDVIDFFSPDLKEVLENTFVPSEALENSEKGKALFTRTGWNYTIDGKEFIFSNEEEALSHFNEMFKDRPEIKSGKIKIQIGKNTKKVSFTFKKGGKTIKKKTYNEAVEALRGEK